MTLIAFGFGRWRTFERCPTLRLSKWEPAVEIEGDRVTMSVVVCWVPQENPDPPSGCQRDTPGSRRTSRTAGSLLIEERFTLGCRRVQVDVARLPSEHL